MTFVRFVALASWSLLVSGLVGCGATRVPQEGPVTREELRSILPDVVCDRVLECECPLDKRSGSDRSHCKASVRLYLEDLFLSDVDETEFDGDLAWECLRAAEEADCESAAWAPLCARVFQPGVEVGASCGSDLHCVGYWEDAAHCDERGTCASGPRRYHGEQGDGCAFTEGPDGSGTGTEDPQGNATCRLVDDLRCEDVCQPVAEEGEPCETVFDCALGTYCDDGVCVSNLELGADCVQVIDFSCGWGNYCSEDGVCATQKGVAAECTEDIECAGLNCSPFGTCQDTGEDTVCEHFGSIEIGD